jgi:hypothetical protein
MRFGAAQVVLVVFHTTYQPLEPVCACARECECECVRACVRACARVRACV